MEPGNIPFNALIVSPTNCGKTQFLVKQLTGPFRGRFDYVVLICPTFAYNKTLYRFAERDPRLDVIICEQHHVEFWLKVARIAFEGTNALIVLDDCASSKDVKGRTEELVRLGFSARHEGISILVYKCLRNFVPIYLKNYFKVNNDVHNYNTRQRRNIHPNKTNLVLGGRTFKNSGRLVFNSLPSKIKEASSLAIFKRLLKGYFI